MADVFESERLLTGSMLLMFSVKVILARIISKLQLLELFVEFVEGNTIVLGRNTNMMKGSRMHHQILMKLSNLIFGKLNFFIKLFKDIPIGSSCPISHRFYI